MRTSIAGIDLIKRFEDEAGFRAGRCSRLIAYRPTPDDVWTIGWGHTRGVHEDMTCTPEQADTWLDEDVAAVERGLTSVLACEVTQGQWDALISLCYNLRGGAKALPLKAPKLWKAIHAGDKKRAVIELVDINHGPGRVVMDGLTRRRQAEAALFLT